MGKNINRTPNFFMDLFVKQKIPGVYCRIKYWNDNLILFEAKKEHYSLTQSHKPFSVALIPDYCKPEPLDTSLFVVNTRKQNNLGYSIFLAKGFNIDTYLKRQFKSSYRNLKKRHLRLENCFNVRYSVFHGHINKEDYLFLMESLKKMLVRRFSQRNDKNEKLDEWDELLSNTYSQIIKKKASLFVIYDDNIPIDISLNYHCDKIMFGAISSYAIEYSKFGMGSIEKIKLLEWCLSNGYKILEFGYGDLEYKKKWSNHIYRFKYQVIYNRNSIIAMLFAKMEMLKLSLKEFLKSKKIDVYYKRLKSRIINKKRKVTPISTRINYEKTTVTDLTVYGELKEVAYDLESSFPLKLIVNEFLYTNIEHKDHIVIHEVVQEPGSYLITGRKIIQKFNIIN